MPKRRGNNEIQIARGRLKGILQDLVELDDDYDENDKANLPLRGRPPKRLKLDKPNSLTSSVHESFVMKLFDRSLDLAKFQENTALYSVCRAWNLNQPRVTRAENINEIRNQEPQKMEKMSYLLENISKNDIGLILNMPSPKQDIDDILEKVSKTINEFSINISTLSKEELIEDHKNQWKKSREQWKEKIKNRHNRYILSFQLLEAIKEI